MCIRDRRKTEAFLFALEQEGRWSPVVLDDGTVSDGKVDTYTRCVEAICGSADTFFTSVFSAQGKRQLSAYRNGEIKTLLADLLGQEAIRAQGCLLYTSGYGLALGRGAAKDLAVIGVGDDGRRGARAFRVFDDLGLAAFHDGDAAIGGAEVDADDLAHDFSFKYVARRECPAANLYA